MKILEGVYYYPERAMLDCNTYVVKGEKTLLIDSGNLSSIESKLREMQADGIKKIDTILLTHLHIDHYSSNALLKTRFGAQIGLHNLQQKYFDFILKGTRFLSSMLDFDAKEAEFKPDFYFGDEFNLCGLKVIPAPGHSPDSLCYWSQKEKFLICGDVVFESSTGRVDLPGGGADQLKNSINELSKLGIAYLLPGHMGIIKGQGNVKTNFDYVREFVFEWLK